MLILDEKTRRALTTAFNALNPQYKARPQGLRLMQGGGLMHDHVDAGNSRHVFRIPRGNQLGLTAGKYLQLQFDIHARAGVCGHVPGTFGMVAPSAELPNGALIVKKIEGRKPEHAQDLLHVADALARIHTLEPLGHANAIAYWHKPFASQIPLLTQVFEEGLGRQDSDLRALIAQKRDRIVTKTRSFMDATPRFYRPRLIGGDSHPGNFMIDRGGKAWLVDMEYATYDTPLIDIADASAALPRRLEAEMGSDIRNADTGPMRARWLGRMAASGNAQPYVEHGLELADDIVNMRTVLWLCDWNAKDPATKGLIAPATRSNWDRLAADVLTRQAVNTLFPAPKIS